MDATEVARQEASRIHQAAVAAGDDFWRPLAFVRREAARRDLDVYAIPQGDPQLRGGRAVFDSQAWMILYEDIGSEFDRAFLIAHELGHIVLENGAQDTVTEHIEVDRSAEEAPIGIERVVDYGAHERREIRMDLFARELLLPRTVARRLNIDENMSSADIASRLGAPLQMVLQQLLDALLLPIQNSAQILPIAVPAEQAPDPKQVEAAEHRNSPFQLVAGPGTGKTHTLILRIESLLAEGVDPRSILVLTFSNKAAQELSDRISSVSPTAATAMWIGTFHAFGLDIIRRFHDKLGLPSDPRLLDKSEAIDLLEPEFLRLPFQHYRNLWDPTLDLNDMLSAISRSKDEVIDAEGYRALAQAMAGNATGDNAAMTRADKCLEVALLFETYERLMASAQAVDFGDLVALPVRLVEAHEDVRKALRARHKHVLVDEYQDVNRASVRLLKGIVGDGRCLWVVGDACQSIYRFRGASATNMRQFALDFPGAQVCQLSTNYRSTQEIVDVFTTFSPTMMASAGNPRLQLTAKRGLTGRPAEFKVVVSGDDEISAVATTIQNERNMGKPFRKQAVLCASNARLNDIAEGLEARGIPVLYLGSIFERPEVKDLLALLSMLADPHVTGLIRTATIPGYEISLQDVVQFVAHLKDSNTAPLEWRQAVSRLPNLAAESQAALTRIASLFQGLSPTMTPWTILAIWVVDRLKIAKSVNQTQDQQNLKKGLALWQFLNFCRRQPLGAGLPCVRLLDRIRRITLLSEDRSLRQMPNAVDDIDAVRLLTIHASKGLEFDIVHIPGMVTSGLPRNNITPRCLPPDGLIHGSTGVSGLDAVRAGHDEEEECLFFVALSRARDQLFLYAFSRQTDGKVRNPSRFIPVIEHLLLRHSNPPQQKAPTNQVARVAVSWEEKPTWTESQISLFERCPRRFLYTHVLKLGGRRTETAFMRMHNVIHDVFQWLKANHETTIPDEDEIETCFTESWHRLGAVGHGYSEDYRQISRRIINYLVSVLNSGVRSVVRPLSLSWPEGEILITPDSVAIGDRKQFVIRRVKTGKPRSNGFDDIEYTLLHLAVEQSFGGQADVEVIYLTSETTELMSISPRKLSTRRQKAQDFVRRIHLGDFNQNEDVRVCPRCPSFFICGKLPSGAVTIKKIGAHLSGSENGSD